MTKNKTEEVDAFMKDLKHPLKAEVEEIRSIIKAINPEITEEIQREAPAFSYKDLMLTFNLKREDIIHLIFLNPHIVNIDNDLLEGDYQDRRMMYINDKADLKVKKPELERIVRELIELIDSK